MRAELVAAVALCGVWVGGACVGGASLGGCGSTPRQSDSGVGIDAFLVLTDASASDAPITPMTDAPVPPMTDAFVTPMTDAPVPPMTDAFVAPMTDAFVAPMLDASVPADAFVSSMPCDQIAAIRLRTGTFAPGLPVTGAVVSYVMPALPAGATDPRGVFVQCPGATGPALFLAISPDDTTAFASAPAVGNVVAFTVTEAADSTTAGGTGDQHRVLSIAGWSVTGTAAIAPQDATALDLPAMLDGLESEMVRLDATVAASGTPAGTGFTSFQITTTGVGTATVDLRLRMPSDVATTLGLAPGCQVRVNGTPLWRLRTSAQPSVWAASELTIVSCPASCTPPSHLVINEVDYDQPSTDTAEFIELFNPTAAPISLAGHTVVHVDGATGHRELGRVALTGTLGAGAYLVIQGMGSTVAGATLTLSSAMQNGPDGVVLVGPAGIVDTAMYEGVIDTVELMGGTVLTVSESASIGSDPGAGSLSRMPNACDRDTPAADWAVTSTPSPGAPNL